MAYMIFAVDNVVKNHEKQNQYISASTELKKTLNFNHQNL